MKPFEFQGHHRELGDLLEAIEFLTDHNIGDFINGWSENYVKLLESSMIN